MSSYLNPRVLANGLNSLVQETTALWITPELPADYETALATYVGVHNLPILNGPKANAGGSGRRVTVEAIAGAPVLNDGVLGAWVLVNERGAGRLLAGADVNVPLDVLAGNQWALAAFDIT